ncbi:MAG: hypothetical protein R2851_05975 [Caldilineaceae bacterium]
MGTTGAMRMVVPPTLAHVPAACGSASTRRGVAGGATTEGGNLRLAGDTLTLPAGDALEASLRTALPAHHTA